jgi:hypothetical protein
VAFYGLAATFIVALSLLCFAALSARFFEDEDENEDDEEFHLKNPCASVAIRG